MQSYKAAIIAVGTEITDGQILNSNAQWLSQQLNLLNIPVVFHMAAPDNKPEMLSAFEFISQQVNLIFICGGLGPTSDDFTRNIISEYFKVPLEFDDIAWKTIELKLQSRQVNIRDGHRNQCYFPKNSKVLENHFGVAPGFYFSTKNKHIWALPGPPPEIESIWTHGVSEQLKKDFSSASKMVLKKWLCLGMAESELAFLTESFFDKFTFSKKYGYRLQVPYVEIKLWHDNSLEALQAIDQFSIKLADKLAGESTEEIYQKFIEKIESAKEFDIVDLCSDGFLFKKFSDIFKNRQPNWNYHLLKNQNFKPVLFERKLFLENHPEGWHVTENLRGHEEKWLLPFPQNRKSKYKNQFLTECLIIKLIEVL